MLGLNVRSFDTVLCLFNPHLPKTHKYTHARVAQFPCCPYHVNYIADK